jgi:hypothetical protein
MRIGNAPDRVEDLDLMRRLEQYGSGEAHWEDQPKADTAACKELHAALCAFARNAAEPLLTRTTAREMEAFTAHDPTHSRKVAHLMWLILPEHRRQTLSPAEIGLMVTAAYLHDMGMGANPEDRRRMLSPDSDLWEILDIDAGLRERVNATRRAVAETMDQGTPAYMEKLDEARQAEEALLCQYLREHHAQRERYESLIESIAKAHAADPAKVPDPRAVFAYDGDSFVDVLIDICVSHNESAWELIRREGRGERFPDRFPVGGCHADTRMVAAALRLADILDFDRERTPAMLYHYLLPTPLAQDRERSRVEWAKHMSIANWSIESDCIRYSARCSDHIAHHAVRLFCDTIQTEIATTREALSSLNIPWPFALPSQVARDIVDDGPTRYHPFHFELDDDRIYRLLMGSHIYDTPLAALRELVQNAVDACLLRDALTKLDDPTVQPVTEGRIHVRYLDADAEHAHPRLVIEDRGTGMDLAILQEFFLKVGRSYYSSAEFNRARSRLRHADDALDFAPTSEFGIGFLSCFLLADRVQVETAHWNSPRGDTKKRTLTIDGPTKLMAVREDSNDRAPRFSGTRVTLTLSKGKGREGPPVGLEVFHSLNNACQDLPYPILCEIPWNGDVHSLRIEPRGIRVSVPEALEPAAYRIPLNAPELGLDGEMVLFDQSSLHAIRNAGKSVEERRVTDHLNVVEETVAVPDLRTENTLIRNGFRIGSKLVADDFSVRVRLQRPAREAALAFRTSVARTGIETPKSLAKTISRLWLSHCLANPDSLPTPVAANLPTLAEGFDLTELQQQFSAWDVYRLVRPYWASTPGDEVALSRWESGDAPAPWKEAVYGSFRLGGGTSRTLLTRAVSLVARLEYDKAGDYYAGPPMAGWRDQLAASHNWANSTFDLPYFVGEIADWLCITNASNTGTGLLSLNSGVMNACYQDRFGQMTPKEYDKLPQVIIKLVNNRHHGKTSELTAAEFKTLQTAARTMGDLLVGGRKFITKTPFNPASFLLPKADGEFLLVGPWPLRSFLE